MELKDELRAKIDETHEDYLWPLLLYFSCVGKFVTFETCFQGKAMGNARADRVYKEEDVRNAAVKL